MSAERYSRAFGAWLTSIAGIPLLAVLIVATINFSVAFTWGMPQATSSDTMSTWQIDTIAPVQPLTEAYYRFTREGAELVEYPLFHYVILDVVFAPYVAYQYLTGGLVNPDGDFPYGAMNPREFFTSLTLIARSLSLAMALGIVVAVFEITRHLFSRNAAIWSALLAALIAPLSYYAKTSNLDVPYLFWTLLAIWQIVLIANNGKLYNYISFAAFAAFAVATKDQAYGFYVCTPLLLIYLHARNTAPSPNWSTILRSAISKPIVLTALVGIVFFSLGNNLLFGGFDGFVRHIDFARAFYDTQLHDSTTPLLEAQLQLVARSIAVVLQFLGPFTLLLVIAGLLLTIAERGYVGICILLLPAASYYLFVLVPAGVVLPRYLLGPAILLLPFAGHALAQLLTIGPFLGYATAFLAVATQVLLSVHLSFTLLSDSRLLMANWIRANVPTGSSIETSVQQRYLPHLGIRYRVSVVGNSFDGITHDTLPEDLTAARLTERKPDYVLVIENIGLTGDPGRVGRPQVSAYFKQLLNGVLGYTSLVTFETGNYLPFRQLTAGTLPKCTLLIRSDLLGS